MKRNDLLEQTFLFGVECLQFLRTLPMIRSIDGYVINLANLPLRWVRIMKDLKRVRHKQILKTR